MLTIATKPTPGTSASAIRFIQRAEMIDTHGVKAIATINGVLFMSSTPASPTDASSINAALVAAGAID